MKRPIRASLFSPSIWTSLFLFLPACAPDVGPEQENAPRGQEGLAPVESSHAGAMEEDHDHEEVELGTVFLGPLKAMLAQAHGPLVAGEEAGLIVVLPEEVGAQAVVRAWLGGPERTESFVGRGEYAPSHGDYDVHAMAPDPLPPGVEWWVEVELPDGTRHVGHHAPLR